METLPLHLLTAALRASISEREHLETMATVFMALIDALTDDNAMETTTVKEFFVAFAQTYRELESNLD